MHDTDPTAEPLPGERRLDDAGSASVVRSEEELAVGTQAVPYERVRLVKRIVTETVSVPVEVQREEFDVVREAVAPDAPPPPRAAPFADETIELTLMEEEVVVTKRLVPRERVRARKVVVTEELGVTDELRKERVEVEGGTEG